MVASGSWRPRLSSRSIQPDNEAGGTRRGLFRIRNTPGYSESPILESINFRALLEAIDPGLRGRASATQLGALSRLIPPESEAAVTTSVPVILSRLLR